MRIDHYEEEYFGDGEEQDKTLLPVTRSEILDRIAKLAYFQKAQCVDETNHP